MKPWNIRKYEDARLPKNLTKEQNIITQSFLCGDRDNDVWKSMNLASRITAFKLLKDTVDTSTIRRGKLTKNANKIWSIFELQDDHTAGWMA